MPDLLLPAGCLPWLLPLAGLKPGLVPGGPWLAGPGPPAGPGVPSFTSRPGAAGGLLAELAPGAPDFTRELQVRGASLAGTSSPTSTALTASTASSGSSTTSTGSTWAAGSGLTTTFSFHSATGSSTSMAAALLGSSKLLDPLVC